VPELVKWMMRDGPADEPFYENLLASVAVGTAMPKAAALAEAKQWLRSCRRRGIEADRAATAAWSAAVAAETCVQAAVPGGSGAAGQGETKPFADPRYWAAFVLIAIRIEACGSHQ